MKPHILLYALISFGIIVSCSSPYDPEHTLWYDSPAATWTETLPLGNGRLGMMPDGDIRNERIVLNEISLWSGCERDYANPDAAASLPEIRQLLLEGKNAEAQALMYQRFTPRIADNEASYGTYQVLGTLEIRTSADGVPESYRRRLDLRNATAYTEYEQDGVHFRRRYHVRTYIVQLRIMRHGFTHH